MVCMGTCLLDLGAKNQNNIDVSKFLFTVIYYECNKKKLYGQ